MKHCNLSETDRKKLNSYIGFALRKRGAIIGVDGISAAKNIKTVIVDGNLRENSRNKLQKALSDGNVEIEIYELTDLGAFVGNPNVKAIGITDKELGKVIIATLTKY